MAISAASCTRENSGYDPALADGGAPAVSGEADGLPSYAHQDASPAPPAKPSCPAGATACTGKDTIRFCKKGVWKTAPCQDVCAAENYHYAVDCRFAPDLNKEACACGHYAGFGELCDDVNKRCAPGLFCGTFSGAKVGFCTRHCPIAGATCAGAPAGTAASCSLQSGGKNACGFVCSFTTQCPKALTCDIFSGVCKP